ncbi:MAG: T9SS type A sorting domain-containing protein [Bacteroidia bacterium]
MKKLLLSLIVLLCCQTTFAQNSTAEYVYDIFQRRCQVCHSNGNPSNGLDLEGSGATQAAKMLSVYQNLVNVTPTNSHAAAAGYKRVLPGHAWRSSLFRKINNGLQPNMVLDPAEGINHDGRDHDITDAEKEAIRQWILFGAPATGKVADSSILRRYYEDGGVPSFQTPPPAPDASEGFQIQIGPFFLEPNDEDEYFWKYPTWIDQDLEVDKMEVLFGPYSHHFIMFEYQSPALAASKREGLRPDNAHSRTELVTVQQYADTLELPEGSAFFWDKGNILDLNTHYVNYSQTKVAACDAYVNVYTKPSGTAKQEMKVALIANTNIFIPNDSVQRTFQENVVNSGGESFIWALTSHTHQYGKDFNVYTRDLNGQKNDLIFDAEYQDGDPTSFYYGYDYQHPPIRYYSDYLILQRGEGLIYEATYNNNGPRPARWGDTSDDEMMVLVFFYLDDTTGVGNVTSRSPQLASSAVQFGPNPTSSIGMVEIAGKSGEQYSVQLMDMHGRSISAASPAAIADDKSRFELDMKHLAPGIYYIRVQDQTGQNVYTGKWLVR